MAAEFGAHLTSPTNDEKPSIFEVLAQESLLATLRPALKHVSKVLAEKNPARYAWLYTYSEELYTLFHLLLEQYYLGATHATFAENFYGLKRVPSPECQGKRLTKQHYWASLVSVVLIPYLKVKVDAWFERIKQDDVDRKLERRPGLGTKMCKIFLTIYPYLHFAWESCHFYYQLAFLFDKSNIHSPLLKLAGVKLKNLSLEDMHRQRDQSARLLQAPASTLGTREKMLSWARKLLGTVALSLSTGLSVSVFFLQFLEWWYSSASYQTTLAVTALPIPDPPQLEEAGDSSRLARNRTICPLCQRSRTNDTALSTSGYVFCYPCIYTYVKGHRKCPVTGYPSEMQHLVKLYLPEDT